MLLDANLNIPSQSFRGVESSGWKQAIPQAFPNVVMKLIEGHFLETAHISGLCEYSVRSVLFTLLVGSL
jgi:hypothetical protein